MHPQLQSILEELDAATARLRRLAAGLTDDGWTHRPAPGRWSPSECVVHLNLTSAAFVPLIRDGLERARRAGGPGPRRYGRGLVGWLLWKSVGSPARFRMKTTAPFIPGAAEPPVSIVADFERLQEEVSAQVRAGDGRDLNRVMITSPFEARMQYNLYACLTILPRHQHRHLQQAEAAAGRPG